jgi:hypothetical protein
MAIDAMLYTEMVSSSYFNCLLICFCFISHFNLSYWLLNRRHLDSSLSEAVGVKRADKDQGPPLLVCEHPHRIEEGLMQGRANLADGTLLLRCRSSRSRRASFRSFSFLCLLLQYTHSGRLSLIFLSAGRRKKTYLCGLETELAVYHGEELEVHVYTNNFSTVESFSKIFCDSDCCGPQLFANMSHLACLTNSYFCHFWPT